MVTKYSMYAWPTDQFSVAMVKTSVLGTGLSHTQCLNCLDRTLAVTHEDYFDLFVNDIAHASCS